MTDLLRRVYRPRGSAREVFRRRETEVCISGPAGTGKSRACLEKVHAMALHNPGSRHLIVRKTLASLGATGLQTWRQYVVPEAQALGVVDFYGGSAQEPPQYRYENGSRVLIGGLDKPSKIMSLEVDTAYVQEATELNLTDWEMLSTRLRNGAQGVQQLLADCNPGAPTHWLKQRADAGTMVMLNAAHTDNPVLYNEDGTLTPKGTAYIGRLDQLTGVRYQRLRKGLWVAAEGLIYGNFLPAVNLVDRPKQPPDDWERIWTVDFGFVHPFVLQCWAVRPKDGALFLYREIYYSHRLVEDHARAILKAVTRADGTWHEPKPSRIICDHDAEDRATLERHLGMPTTAAKKSVSDGIQATDVRFRDARLFIVRGATLERDQTLIDAGRPASTEEEIPGYVWKPGKDGALGKDEPVKEMDDGCDAMRYAVADQDLRGEVRFRKL
jgi:PBSX family phage terminase large subunit